MAIVAKHGKNGLIYVSGAGLEGANAWTYAIDTESAEYAKFGDDFAPIDLLRTPQPLQWGLGVRELAQSILADRPHRVTGEQAAHVVEILEAMTTAMTQQKPVSIQSDFVPPSPLDWAL